MAHRKENTAAENGCLTMIIPCPYPRRELGGTGFDPRIIGSTGELTMMPQVARHMDGSLGELKGMCQVAIHMDASLGELKGMPHVARHMEASLGECPYKTCAPKNAIVGKHCEIVCKVCAGLFSGRCCNQDLGRARIRYCQACLKIGEHRLHECPQMMLRSRGSINVPGSSSLDI